MRILLTIVGALLLAASLRAQDHIIKFATLAPDGTTWVKVLREYDAAIRRESGGKLGFKIWPNGVQGEDKDVIRKMRRGQLHSAGLTGVGLGEIAPMVRILDSPFLFESYGEVDHVYEKFGKEFSDAFLSKDYVLLGWVEVGFVYVFTNTPVRKLSDMKGVKMWMWEGDPVAEATFGALNINPTPLSVVDVLTSLQTGLIDGMYVSPYAAVGLQWNTRVKYMMDVPLADAAGAVVMTKSKFDTLPKDLQEILVTNGRKYLRTLTLKSREENAAAIEAMKKGGIKVMSPSDPASVKEYAEAGRKARRSLAGRLYDAKFLDRVEKAVLEYRAAHAGKK